MSDPVPHYDPQLDILEDRSLGAPSIATGTYDPFRGVRWGSWKTRPQMPADASDRVPATETHPAAGGTAPAQPATDPTTSAPTTPTPVKGRPGLTADEIANAAAHAELEARLAAMADAARSAARSAAADPETGTGST
ncbi:hypothetical protein VZC37_22915 [Gordonia sp. LSe1-13]|uniref:Uncharacterized protein n=1 Tax=Gordonia sesuvii TaxID=3116777 RepID=A0ABU7MJM1_9ACTN|nr:hypothetical protein [Gordonia sp. LSe1-13]